VRFNQRTFEMEDHGFDVHCFVLHIDCVDLDLHKMDRLFKPKKH